MLIGKSKVAVTFVIVLSNLYGILFDQMTSTFELRSVLFVIGLTKYVDPSKVAT